MADAPGGGGAAAAGKLDPQAAIASHAVVTQAGAGGDQAIIQRIESSIAHSPMGWLQSMMGEVDTKSSSERGEVQGKVNEQKELVASKQKDAPKEAGAPPALGQPAHPAMPHPSAAGATGPAVAPAAPAGGTAPVHKAVTGGVPAGGGAPPSVPTPTIAAAVSGAGNDAQLDQILNGYTPKGQQSTQMLGRIKQMGDVAQGFNGQLDVYVAQGGAVEHGIAAVSNFFGAGKDTSAVWATNPYRKVHGILGGIMTGLSAVKSVCSIVGSICGKLGLVLTVIGLLGMIFPPVGVAVSGIARILNVVGIICDAISFVLSGILTGLNGVVLAQQISAGASAEEKAATADMMMSEANDAASGFVNMAMLFGPKFMKGLLGNSKGVVSSLLRRAKAVIGRVSLKVSADVKLFASKIARKMGFGGASMSRVAGGWKDTGLIARTSTAMKESKLGKAFYGAPKHIESIQTKLMAKYGNTGWAKNLDRAGAWGGSVAHRFDLEEKVGNWGESSGKALGGISADTKFGKNMAQAADRAEKDTREAAMKAETRDAAHLEGSRWNRELDKRQAGNPEHLRDPAAEKKFVAQQQQKVQDKGAADFEAAEKKRVSTQKADAMRTDRFERHNDDFYEDKTGFSGVSGRDEYMNRVHGSRDKRFALEAKYQAQETERHGLLAKTTRSTEEETRLGALNTELKPLDESRRLNKTYENELSGMASGRERVKEPDLKNWHDVGTNVWNAADPAAQLFGIESAAPTWASAEKYNLRKPHKWDKGGAMGGAASRGGHGTFQDIAASTRADEQASFSAFVRKGPQPTTVTGSVRSMLAGVGNKAKAPGPAPGPAPVTTTAPAPSPAPAPVVASAVAAGPVAPAPVAGPAPVAAGPSAAPVAATPAGGPAVAGAAAVAGSAAVGLAASTHEPPPPAAGAPSGEGAGADADTGEALPYWPALLPEFDKATHDFGYMQQVAVEFKKAQIAGKQKAVDTLAVYGKYAEYAKLRQAQAGQHQASTQQTTQSTQQNTDHAGQTQAQAGQGEAKQSQAQGAAQDKAAVDLPEPESRGFWDRILGAVKRWAKNKAAQVFGWIQEKIASVVLQGLCGVSMGDMRQYAGALQRQQQAAHGVATGATKTTGAVTQTAVKLGTDANKEAQSAADAIGECDRNITDADAFMADLVSFEAQLAEEKAYAQTFIAQIQASAHAEQDRKRQEADQSANEEHAAQQRDTQLDGGTSAEPTPSPDPTPQPVVDPIAGVSAPPPEPDDPNADADVASIHTASSYVATSAEGMVAQLDARASDYQNQLALALTNHTGKDQQGVDLKGPSKRESTHIVEEFKTYANSTKHDMEGFHNMAIDPSSSRRIADTIIQTAEHLDANFQQSQQALDELFERTYKGIRDGKRTLKSNVLDGDNMVGNANKVASQAEDSTFHAAQPTMDAAWNTVSAPIQMEPTPAPAPTANPAQPPPPREMLAMNDAQPVQRKADGDAGLEGEAAASVAERGTQGAGGGLPHGDQIQRSFGRHDIGGIRAHVGGAAAESSDALGAQAYAHGDAVAFKSSPDLHTAAHEAAHVVQQRQGVQLKGGIDGGAGDPHEQHADAVADAVVAGKSAEPLLDQVARGGTSAPAVQRKPGDPPTTDTLPPPTLLQVVGDRFQLTFRRGVEDRLYCDVHYEGDLKASGLTLNNNTMQLSEFLGDPKRAYNAKIISVDATGIVVDVYGDGVTIAKLTDTAKPGINSRRHIFQWTIGGHAFGSVNEFALELPPAAKPIKGAAPETHSLNFRAVDEFALSATRFGDANSVAVTLASMGDAPMSVVFEVPVEGDLTKVVPKVISNDGRTISFDLNSDGKVDLTLIHTVKETNKSFDGKSQSREHHFRQFDKDGCLIGDQKEGMRFFNHGPTVAIPKLEDEATNAPPLDKEAPLTRPPAQGDVIGELPQAIRGPGDVIEMRIDGDGDRTKELVLRFKAIAGAGAAAADHGGHIQLEMIQLSSVASGTTQTKMFDVTADAAQALAPSITQVANGYDPLIIDVISQQKSAFGARLQMQLFPPQAEGANRTYPVSFGGKIEKFTFPAETSPTNPLVKTVSAGQNIGNVARFEVTLGEFGDRFWVMHEAQPDGTDAFSVVALNPEGPATARGIPLVLAAKKVTTFAQVNAGPTSFAIDLDGDGKPDIQLFDALSTPLTTGGLAPLAAERDHTITVMGTAIGGPQKWGYHVRNGKFTTQNFDDHGGSADKAAAAGASAVAILKDQADESRSKDDKGNTKKDGDIDVLLSRIAGALTANRQKAKQAGLINDKLYTAWESLADELNTLGPQISVNKVNADLQKKAADNASTFYNELSAATAGTETSHSVTHNMHGDSDTSTTKTNKYTGTVIRTNDYSSMSIDGPGYRLDGEIRSGKWTAVTTDFNQLVVGLDKWIAAKMKPGSDDQKQQQYLVAMQGAMQGIAGKPTLTRVNAAFQPDKSYNTNTNQWGEIPLMLFTWKEDDKWWLKDLTNPEKDISPDSVKAHDGETAPPVSIFKELDYARNFPKGIIHYQIPNGQGGQLVTTERKHWWEFAQWIGLGLAAVGITLASFGTAAPIVATCSAVAFAASGVANAVYAIGDLQERAKRGELEPAAVVMDVAQIVAGFFTAGAAISGRIVSAAAQADINVAKGVAGAASWTGAAAKWARFAQSAYMVSTGAAVAADGVNLLALGADTITQIDKIMNGDGTPDAKKAAVIQLITQGIVLGGIAVLSIKGQMPELMSGRPTIVIDYVGGVPVARANHLEIAGGKITPPTGANAAASARWQTHGIEEAVQEGSAGAKALTEDPEFMKAYRAWMEQSEPKIKFGPDGKPKVNFAKGFEPTPEVAAKLQKFVDTRGVGISLYERAWSNADQLKKVEDAVAKQGGELDLEPGSASWREHRPEIVKALGGDHANAEALVSRYERMRLGAGAGNPKEYLAERDQLRKLLPDTEVERIRSIFPEYEVYVTGGATQTVKADGSKAVIKGDIADVDVIVVVPKGTPPELMAAIEGRARGQAVRPDPGFLHDNKLDPNRSLKLDVKVMTPDQMFGFAAASGGSKSASPLNLTRIDVTPAELELAKVRAKATGSLGGLQTTNDLDKLYKGAEVARTEIDGLAKSIASKYSGEASVPGLKGRARAEEKIKADYKGDASKLTDIARGSIIFDKFDDLERAATEIEGTAKIVRKKDRFAQPADGYRDILYNVEASNGHVGELQLQLRAVQNVKDGAGHQLYEQIRSIEAKAKIESRDLTPAEQAQVATLKVQMQGQYDAAFESTKAAP